MSKLITSAIWLLRKALDVSPEDWQVVREKVAEAAVELPDGASRRAWVLDALSDLFTSRRVLGLFIELAVQLLGKTK